MQEKELHIQPGTTFFFENTKCLIKILLRHKGQYYIKYIVCICIKTIVKLNVLESFVCVSYFMCLRILCVDTMMLLESLEKKFRHTVQSIAV